jgi:inosine-uridine nucleoside N-ribohydrolase
VDVSIKTPFTEALLRSIAGSSSLAAQYIAKYSPAQSYLWDELAACAWLDRSVITKERVLYMDVDLSHGASYGNTLTWDEKSKPATGVRLVHAQVDLDLAKFTRMFAGLMTAK